MLSTLLQNLWQFALSMPTNIIILLLICAVMMLSKKFKFKDCVKVIVAYLAIGLLLGIFGITMPSFISIGRWLVNLVKTIFNGVW